MPYESAFAFEIALEYDPPEEVCARFGVSDEDYRALLEYEPFLKELADHKAAIRDKGLVFELKAKQAAEALLPVVVDLARDIEVPPSVRLAAVQSLAKWGRLEPQKSDNEDTSPKFVLQIDTGSREREIKDVTPPPGVTLNPVFEEPTQ